MTWSAMFNQIMRSVFVCGVCTIAIVCFSGCSENGNVEKQTPASDVDVKIKRSQDNGKREVDVDIRRSNETNDSGTKVNVQRDKKERKLDVDVDVKRD